MRPSLPLRAFLLSTCLLSFAASRPAAAISAVPSPSNSSIPQCLIACPAGDLSFTIVVRDLANNPVAGSTVVLDFTACPAFVVCSFKTTDPYIYDAPSRTIRAITDATGTVRFPIRGGGVCGTANGVRVFADGVFLAGCTMASTDQDGDLFVGAVDVGIVSGKVGGTDPTADFDCDFSVTAADKAVVSAHQSHGCDGPTPTRPSTWGGVKIIYR